MRTVRRHLGARLLMTLLAAAFLLPGGGLGTRLAGAQQAETDSGPPPLFQQEPYDELHLTDGSVVKVDRILFEDGKPPENPKPTDKIIVRPLNEPNKEYAVLWRNIQQLKLFELLVLEEAEGLVHDGKFDQAYPYYEYLQRFKDRLPQFKPSLQRYLFAEAQSSKAAGKLDQALALLNELHRHNGNFTGLDEALAEVTDQRIQHYLAKDDFRSSRQLLKQLEDKYPQHPTVQRWREHHENRARGLLRQSQAHLEAGRLHEARDVALSSVRIWPLPEASQLLDDAQRRAPRVVVGVTTAAEQFDPTSLNDWAARRAGRLLHRTLEEYFAPGPQGGDYRSPFGEVQRLDLGRRLAINLNPRVTWLPQEIPLTAADISRHLLAVADPRHQAYQPNVADLIASVETIGPYELEVHLRRSHILPEALFTGVIERWNHVPSATVGFTAGTTAAASSTSPANSPFIAAGPVLGPYVRFPNEQSDGRFRLNERYFARGPRQPTEVVERRFPDGRAAIMALLDGQIAVLDRVNPWDLDRLRPVGRLQIVEYAVPTVTCLVPNPQHPLLAARTFRRALVVGINRQAILEQLLKGSAARGDRVVSAPLPAPRNADDPLGYAYNKSIDPRPYHPWLAMTLVSLTLKQAQEKEKADAVQAAKAAQQAAPNPQGAGNQVAAPGAAQPSPAPAAPPTAPARPAEPTEPPGPSKVEQALAKPLVLAHPPHDVARVACRAIQRQLHLVGLMVELRELSPASPASEDVALRYTEVFMQEPLIDVQRLFGQGGIAPHGNPYLRLALRELERSPDWRRAHEKLNDIHRLVHEDATVIPLWQISEHLAHHKALQGTASQPLTLYQQIEQWQSPPAVLPDSP